MIDKKRKEERRKIKDNRQIDNRQVEERRVEERGKKKEVSFGIRIYIIRMLVRYCYA